VKKREQESHLIREGGKNRTIVAQSARINEGLIEESNEKLRGQREKSEEVHPLP